MGKTAFGSPFPASPEPASFYFLLKNMRVPNFFIPFFGTGWMPPVTL
jgi:hypothetical protein